MAVAGGRPCIGAIIVIFAIGYLMGFSPQSGADMVANAQQSNAPDQNDPMRNFLAHVIGGTEEVWSRVLPVQKGVQYQPATFVLYDGTTPSGCGVARSAMGPFYCRIDKKVYLDPSFFRDLKTKYGVGGDFAYAYLIAREIGRHVQNLLGILDKVDDTKRQASPSEANALSVKLELQADCLVGVWVNHANEEWKILERGDIEQALATAEAIDDDRKAGRGYSVPPAVRKQWFTTGLRSGQIDACNTFASQKAKGATRRLHPPSGVTAKNRKLRVVSERVQRNCPGARGSASAYRRGGSAIGIQRCSHRQSAQAHKSRARLPHRMHWSQPGDACRSVMCVTPSYDFMV